MENIKLNERLIEHCKAQIETMECLQKGGYNLNELLEQAEKNLRDSRELGRVLDEKIKKQEGEKNE